jgi:hypothetical protein
MDVITYDYLGYGLSSKSDATVYPSESGCYKSLQIVTDHFKERYDEIYQITQSIGTGVCVDHCANNEWTESIALIPPYKSLARVVTETSLVGAIDSSSTRTKRYRN